MPSSMKMFPILKKQCDSLSKQDLILVYHQNEGAELL